MLLCVQLRYVNMVSRAILIYPSGFNRSSNRDHLPSLSWKELPSSSCPIALPCSSWTYRNEYKRIVPAYASYLIGGLSRDVRTRPRSNRQFYLDNFTRTHMLSFPTGNEIVIDHTSLKIDIFILTDSELNESQQKVSTRIISYSFLKSREVLRWVTICQLQ